MKNLFPYAFLVFAFSAGGQNQVLVKAEPHLVKIKWYRDGLISKSGCDVYRQAKGNDNWQKVNEKPITFRQNRIAILAASDDPELGPYLDMAEATKNLKGLPLIALLVKSFSSVPLSNYLGICFEDTSASRGTTYRYKVITTEGNAWQEIGISAWLVAGVPGSEDAPRQFAVEAKGRTVRAGWKNEPKRYFAVNILRKINDTGEFRIVTPQPLLFTNTRNSRKLNDSVEVRFEDKQLPRRSTAWYKVQGLDFFGEPTLASEALVIHTGDDEAPTPADSIKLKAADKLVELSWIKKPIEEDLRGFRVYRTTRSDTDFRVVSALIPPSQRKYTDTVPTYGAYFYKIASADKSGNEGVTDAFPVEVYDAGPPGIPTGLKVVADTARLILQWSPPIEKDVQGYLIYRGIKSKSTSALVRIISTPVPCCEYFDSLPRNAGNVFEYRIVAVDSALNKSPYSERAAAKMIDVTQPSRPFLKSVARNQNDEPVLEWFLNYENDLLGYELFVKNKSDIGGYSRSNRLMIPKDINIFTDHTERPPGVYSYYLVAVDSALNRSPGSNTLQITHKEQAQEHVAQLEIEADYLKRKKEVRVKWQGTARGLRGYVLYRSLESGQAPEALTQLTQQDYLTDKLVRQNTEYSYQVRAYHDDGRVVRSEWINVKTK